MKKLAMITVFVSAMGVHGVANAEFYLAADLTTTSFDYNDVDDAKGRQFTVGYSYDNNLFIEFRYLDAGDADVDGSYYNGAVLVNDLELELSGYLATLGYAFPLGGQESSWGAFTRGGFYHTETEASGRFTTSTGSQTGTVSEDTTAFTLGVGLEWMPTSVFGFRGAFDVLFNTKDYADDNNVTVMTLGTILRF